MSREMKKFAWLPVYIKSPRAIIFMQRYSVVKDSGFPVLCDDFEPVSKYYKLINHIGFLSFRF